jgi:hypothetical protein
MWVLRTWLCIDAVERLHTSTDGYQHAANAASDVQVATSPVPVAAVLTMLAFKTFFIGLLQMFKEGSLHDKIHFSIQHDLFLHAYFTTGGASRQILVDSSFPARSVELERRHKLLTPFSVVHPAGIHLGTVHRITAHLVAERSLLANPLGLKLPISADLHHYINRVCTFLRCATLKHVF